jgi:regulator of protease activity HflC (stomatin/prohibitin superfamily)
VASIAVLCCVGLFSGCGYRNVETPAGYVGYLTQGSLAGKTVFVGTQTGPTSSGLNFLYNVVNVSVTPYTFDELFSTENSTGVLAKDQLAVSFGLHIVFRIKPDQVQNFVEKYTTLSGSDTPDRVVIVAYNNFVKEPARTFARAAVGRFDGLEIESHIDQIQSEVAENLKKQTATTPFEILNVVVGNVQFPPVVTQAVANKIASQQELARMTTQTDITRKQAEQRELEAEGIAKSMETINRQLTPEYIQYEAVKAQLATVNSPNHTTIYIPVGPMGVPLVGTLPTASAPAAAPAAAK